MDNLPPHLQSEHRCCVKADAARKRAARAFSNQGLAVPPAYLRRETEEFDQRHGLRDGRRVFAGSSSRAVRAAGEGSSAPRSPLEPRRLLLEEEFEAYDPAVFEGGVRADDFVSDDILDHVTAVIAKRSVAEGRDDKKHRHVVEDCDDVLLEQGVAQLLQSVEKKA